MATTVASANLLFRLPATTAQESLRQVLDQAPDLIGLQEWYVSRVGLLRATGDVTISPSFGLVRLPANGRRDFHWVAAIGADCVVGARADRYDLLESRSVLLSGLGTSEREDHPLHLEPPRIAAVGIFSDRTAGGTVALVSYHLVPGAEERARYRADRPRLVARHRHEVQRTEELVADLHGAGHEVYAVGDANFHLLPLAGLASAWTGREGDPGTIGRGKRKIDDIHGPSTARAVRLIATASDHKAVVAEFD
jgi:endonuclease/exonuclease/phosphatase family metal-dependent hydrolase